MLFDVQVGDRDGWCVVTVVGDVDLATLPRLWAAIEALSAPQVAVDLRSVNWFDVVCTGALVAGAQRARRRQGRFVVLAAASVANLLADSRLEAVMEVLDRLPPA